jgi:Asp-tRNA(Asn)/Glu-tRNA(Gln) amidotransferase A subunit family amidase
LTILLYEAAEYHRRWATEFPEKYGADVLRLIRLGFDVSRGDYENALRDRQAYEEAAPGAMLGADGLILPATAIVAPPIESADDVRERLARFTRPFNTTHQPVAVVPARVDGLPVGIQVVGRDNQSTLRAAAWLERQWR